MFQAVPKSMRRFVDPRTRPDDCALLLRARRMAQRSRAAAACLPCKATKSKCSDFRPCVRCKMLERACQDLQTDSFAKSEPLTISAGWDERENSSNASLHSDTPTIIDSSTFMPKCVNPLFLPNEIDISPIQGIPGCPERAISDADQVRHRKKRGAQ